MILRALYELSHAEGLMADPDYEPKPVAWLVRVSESGRLLGIEGTHQASESKRGQTAKPAPKRFPVPRQPTRTSADRAAFLCDKAEYVFGIDPQPDPKKRRPAPKLAARRDLFRRQLEDCAEKTRDQGVRAVAKMLADVAAGNQRVTLPGGCAPNDLFAFVYAPDVDLLLHQRPKVRQYWRAVRARSESNASGRRCLVTGAPVGQIANFPAVRKVPGGQPSGVSLVSFNDTAFESYGWSRNENAPISRGAAEACATALARLVDPGFPDPATPGTTLPPRHFRLSADTIVCFWSPEQTAREFLDSLTGIFYADPGQVGEVYRSLWRGRPVELDPAARFYALTLTGAQGRAIVRDWFESSVADVARNLAKHFADLAIVRNTPSPKDRELLPQVPLRAMLRSLAPQGKDEGVPAVLAAQLVNAALRGTLYPFWLLQRALQRMRAEIGKTDWADFERRDARAALIRAVLNRFNRVHRPNEDREITVAMDPSNSNPGYLLGRLMAVIERLQQLALKDVNASVVDRYFGAASATPRAVFTRLLKNARHHARKAKDDPQTAGTAQWLERQIDEIAARFDPQSNGFPAYLDLEQQGLFVLGYHQQRHWLWMSREERAAWDAGGGREVPA